MIRPGRALNITAPRRESVWVKNGMHRLYGPEPDAEGYILEMQRQIKVVLADHRYWMKDEMWADTSRPERAR